jgi:hypothetical protein
MKLLSAILLGVALTGASASCINGCSGHGFCGAFDLCTCYGNWAGNDCSGRVCPQTKAWVDTAIAAEDAHNYATCGNKGDCNGKSGECACYEPFEGKGCRRMACPNGCSGHGTCEYIEELALNADCAWDSLAQGMKTNCVHSSITGYASTAITYTGWDRNKIQGCQCDPGWSGIDCSGRICPMGNDPLRTRNTDDSAVQVPTTFRVQVGWPDDVDAKTDADAPTFVLAFTDTYNEKWYTRPIALIADPDTANSGASKGYKAAMTATTDAQLTTAVYHALLDLPNAAITGTTIDPVTGVATTDSATLTVVAARLGDGAAQDHTANIDITFNSPHNSGPLTNKLECHIAGCDHVGSDSSANPGGCSPKYQGVNDGAAAGAVVEACTVSVTTVGTTNQDTCSSRGSCDGGSGLCSCYEGYTDEDCSLQTVLV